MSSNCLSGRAAGLLSAVSVALGCCVLLLANGCGKSTPSPQQAASSEQTGHGTGTGDATANGPNEALPTASIGGIEGRSESQPQSSEPEKGSPEWLIREILRLRKSPFAEKTGSSEFQQARRKRAEQIVELATEAVAKTHNDPHQNDVFLYAVQSLMESRLQLALDGDAEHIDALYADADALYQRNSDSKAAAEAAFVCARFAHTNARRFAKQEPRWLKEFARQASAFATHFPQEQSRAVSLLHAAAWSCELNGLLEDAVKCYEQLKTAFPQSPQGQQATAVLRRLRLKGQPLQLAGPTLNDKFVSIDDYAGKVVLIVFWASENLRFQEQLPKLTAAIDRLPPNKFSVLGVNLDEEPATLVAFQKAHDLNWPQIFYADADKRRWDNPIVRYYGIRDIPMLWLVDPQGTVVETQLAPENLESRVRALLGGDG